MHRKLCNYVYIYLFICIHLSCINYFVLYLLLLICLQIPYKTLTNNGADKNVKIAFFLTVSNCLSIIL